MNIVTVHWLWYYNLEEVSVLIYISSIESLLFQASSAQKEPVTGNVYMPWLASAIEPGISARHAGYRLDSISVEYRSVLETKLWASTDSPMLNDEEYTKLIVWLQYILQYAIQIHVLQLDSPSVYCGTHFD